MTAKNAKPAVPVKTKAYIPQKPCHEGTIEVFQVNSVHVYGGGTTNGLEIYPDSVVINLTGRESSVPITAYGRAFKKLERYSYHDGLVIDWPDFEAPSFPRKFWTDLIEVLNDLPKPADVIFHCTGGHGRTGTALSIMAGLYGVVPEGTCPIKFVRDHYCEKAVESIEQKIYIQRITGLICTTPVYDKFGLGYGASYGSGYATPYVKTDAIESYLKDSQPPECAFCGCDATKLIHEDGVKIDVCAVCFESYYRI